VAEFGDAPGVPGDGDWSESASSESASSDGDRAGTASAGTASVGSASADNASAGSGIRASRRKIRNTIAARITYTTLSVVYPMGMSLAPVTAWLTRMTS
jgi:hypothetical protein